jgi:bifunctional UDP-N-acetylglucosamine pyrophosphorylase / glucosamine-1-phosphate N-acetyltransferase
MADCPAAAELNPHDSIYADFGNPNTMQVVILAAGQGKRMRSELPKVLHTVAGKPLLARVLATARALGATHVCVVYGHGGERVRDAFAAEDEIVWVKQETQQGTGHAVQQAWPLLSNDDLTLVLYGDVPLTAPETLRRLAAAAEGGNFGLLTVDLADPTGYGRIVRDSAGVVARVVEQKDATPAELAIREVNSGIMAIPTTRLRHWLEAIRNHNAQGEYYLTDIVELAVAEGVPVVTVSPRHDWETLGVNSKAELAELERFAQKEIAKSLMDQGVTLRDPARLDVRGELVCGRDVEIDVNCVFEGRVEIGDDVRIGANCVLRNVKIGSGTRIAPFTLADDSDLGSACQIGPFSRLRPGCVLTEDVHIGNFVEIKNT